MLTIVVPTYKEADNLALLASAVDKTLSVNGTIYELLIVDDNSPDDTVNVCALLSHTYPVRLLQPTGRPRDLSISVIDGIEAARYLHVMVMDADLSHPVETIPAMLDAMLENPRAFVVGSRYIPGGSFDRQWGIWRFLNSHLATLMARPLVKCTDPMSGFFGFNKTCLPDTGQLQPIGYKVGLEIMVRGEFGDIIEVPIGFKDREVGTSKMNFGQQLKYLQHLRRLYFYKFRNRTEFVHFGVVGASGFIVDVIFFYLFQALGVPHTLARGLSFWPAVSWNWLLHRQSTFGHRPRRAKLRQWLEFVFASTVGFSFNWSIYIALTSQVTFFDQYRMLALMVGVASASLFNFAASTWFVYSKTRI
jgi:dolichol-phosphate mannosyltransferase